MSTHPNHRRGHGRIPHHGCGRPGCGVCSAKRKPDPEPARVAVAEGLADVGDDALDFWATPDGPTWRERWDGYLDETEVGREVVP